MQGKTVIEFGPWAGLQTAFLVTNRVERVTCVEARPENVAKLTLLRQLLDWRNVEIIQSDYHLIDAETVGTFDLVFAHGVHYHSRTPFTLLDKWLGMAPALYYGAWCAGEQKPAGPWETISFGGTLVEAKRIGESKDQLSGLGSHGFLFRSHDIERILRHRGYSVTIVSDESVDHPYFEKYFRVLALRSPRH